MVRDLSIIRIWVDALERTGMDMNFYVPSGKKSGGNAAMGFHSDRCNEKASVKENGKEPGRKK